MTGRLARVWILLALIFTALCVVQGGHQLWESAGLPDGKGTVGVSLDQSCSAGDACLVTAVKPGGPAESAGVGVGDRLVFDNPIDLLRRVPVGKTRSFTLHRPEGDRPIVLTAVPAPSRIIPEYVFSSLLLILTGLMGGLVIARSEGRPALVLVGLAYASYAITGQWPRLWQSDGDLFAPFYVVLNIVYYGAPLLFLAGARALRKEVSGRDTLGIRLAFWALVIAQGAILAYQLRAELTGTTGLFGNNAFLAYTVPVFVGYALAAAVLAMAWRESAPAHRSRYGIMLIAIGATFLSGVFDMAVLLTGNDYTTISPLLVGWYVAFLVGAGLFAYAILRDKVIDLGFAVNRTLVYGLLSTVLLFAFWFCEWGLEEIIPAETREANILISAGIAFAIFLTFHHVRDWVEKAIEHMFFRAWREKDAALTKFVKQAAFVTREDNLRTAAVTAFRRYAEDGDVALYAAEPDGYLRKEGWVAGGPDRIGLDEPEMVRLRADLEAFDDGLPADAALILPMIHRNEISGFFLFGPKANGEVFRPDERTILAEAALKIGSDLHALRVDALEIDSREQRQRADILEQQLWRAMSVQSS